MQEEIQQEIYRAIELLGGKSDILGTIASWNNEIDEETVLAGIKAWNKNKAKELKSILER